MPLTIGEFESSATIGTAEYSIPAATTTGVPTSQTADGLRIVYIDFANMVAGDQYQVKCYEKVQSAGSQRTKWTSVLTGAQAEVFEAYVGSLGHGWDITIKKLAGTDRSIAWRVDRVI